jgi:predicted membrane protein
MLRFDNKELKIIGVILFFFILALLAKREEVYDSFEYQPLLVIILFIGVLLLFIIATLIKRKILKNKQKIKNN